MRLHKRVNYILLPIIFVVLAVSGLFVYQVMKQAFIDNLTDKLTNDGKRIQEEIFQQAHESIGLLRLFLSSREAISYLNSPDSYYTTYSNQGQLFNNFNLATETAPFLRSITIFNLDKKDLFHLDVNDPFSVPDMDKISHAYIDQFRNSDDLRELLIATEPQFKLVFDDNQMPQLMVLTPYSASHVLTDIKYTAADNLFIIRLINNNALLVNAKQLIQRTYEGGVELTFEFDDSLAAVNVVATGTKPLVAVTSGISLRFENGFGTIVLSLTSEYLTTLLKPLKLSTGFVFSLLMIVLYTMIRWMIHVQILSPIETLVRQIQDSHSDVTGSELHILTTDDEVAELNNSYIELLSHVSHLATFDSLTGLLNRNSFTNALARSVKDSMRKNKKTALLYIDLDNFKLVNDTFGHAEGDALLVEFGKRIRETLRPFDELTSVSPERGIARLAGDEFALLLTDLPNAEAADSVAQRIMKMFDDGFKVAENVHDVQACIGITLAPDDGTEVEMLVRNADAAMYSAKQSGKNSYRFYAEDIEQKMQVRHNLEVGLKNAIENSGFHLVFMPIYNAKDLSIAGVEVLIRSTEPLLDGFGPDQYISVAEQSGLVMKIDLWVIEEAFKSHKALSESVGFDGFFAINISARELYNDHFVSDLEALFDAYLIEPSHVELEITETYLEPNDASLVNNLMQLKALGLRLSLDDFGTGYTAFRQLASYPVDIIKIDRSFTQEIHQDVGSQRLTVDIIVELARLYELSIVAEGVEDLQQLEYLQDLGVECVQGFYLSRPLSYEDFSALISASNVDENYP